MSKWCISRENRPFKVFVVVMPKKGWAHVAVHILLLAWHWLFENIIYDVKFWKVGVIPKEGWAWPCTLIFLLVWQRQRPWGPRLFSRGARQILSITVAPLSSRNKLQELPLGHTHYILRLTSPPMRKLSVRQINATWRWQWAHLFIFRECSLGLWVGAIFGWLESRECWIYT